MFYKVEIEIAKPIDKVIGLFESPDSLKKWYPDLVSFEQVEGTPDAEGSTAKLIYNQSKKEFAIFRTLIRKNLPDEISYTCENENKSMINISSNYFHKLDTNTTKWMQNNEFKLNGMMRLLGLFPFMFKKQSLKYMESFKELAEGN